MQPEDRGSMYSLGYNIRTLKNKKEIKRKEVWI